MNAQRQAKASQVKEISEKLAQSKSLVVADYAGLTVKQLQDLRAQLAEKGVEIKVYKNRLFKIAATEHGHEEINSELVGPNIYAFGMDDDIAPAKIMAAFAKDNEALELKAGIYEGNVIDADGVKEVATLPSYEEALTMLATSLLAPVNQIGKGLHLLVEEGHLEGSADAATSEEAAPAEEQA